MRKPCLEMFVCVYTARLRYWGVKRRQEKMFSVINWKAGDECHSTYRSLILRDTLDDKK